MFVILRPRFFFSDFIVNKSSRYVNRIFKNSDFFEKSFQNGLIAGKERKNMQRAKMPKNGTLRETRGRRCPLRPPGRTAIFSRRRTALFSERAAIFSRRSPLRYRERTEKIAEGNGGAGRIVSKRACTTQSVTGSCLAYCIFRVLIANGVKCSTASRPCGRGSVTSSRRLQSAKVCSSGVCTVTLPLPPRLS